MTEGCVRDCEQMHIEYNPFDIPKLCGGTIHDTSRKTIIERVSRLTRVKLEPMRRPRRGVRNRGKTCFIASALVILCSMANKLAPVLLCKEMRDHCSQHYALPPNLETTCMLKIWSHYNQAAGRKDQDLYAIAAYKNCVNHWNTLSEKTCSICMIRSWSIVMEDLFRPASEGPVVLTKYYRPNDDVYDYHDLIMAQHIGVMVWKAATSKTSANLPFVKDNDTPAVIDKFASELLSVIETLSIGDTYTNHITRLFNWYHNTTLIFKDYLDAILNDNGYDASYRLLKDQNGRYADALNRSVFDAAKPLRVSPAHYDTNKIKDANIIATYIEKHSSVRPTLTKEEVATDVLRAARPTCVGKSVQQIVTEHQPLEGEVDDVTLFDDGSNEVRAKAKSIEDWYVKPDQDVLYIVIKGAVGAGAAHVYASETLKVRSKIPRRHLDGLETFRLISLVCRSENPDHYFAYTSSGNKYFKHDDSIVSEENIDRIDVLNTDRSNAGQGLVFETRKDIQIMCLVYGRC